MSSSGDADYTTIKEACANVPEGSEIIIEDGIYDEEIRIDKF